MFKRQFLLSWLFSSIGMFVLSYLWHGYVLLDFVNYGEPSGLILFYKIVIYLVIGFVIASVVRLKTFDKRLKYLPVVKGLIVGCVCGILFFALSTFKGISFNVTLNHKYLLLNFFWQLFEQMMGGIIVGVVHNLVFDPSMIAKEEENLN